jgi:hypothetical protein
MFHGTLVPIINVLRVFLLKIWDYQKRRIIYSHAKSSKSYLNKAKCGKLGHLFVAQMDLCPLKLQSGIAWFIFFETVNVSTLIELYYYILSQMKQIFFVSIGEKASYLDWDCLDLIMLNVSSVPKLRYVHEKIFPIPKANPT